MVRAEDDNSRVQNRIAELVGPKRYKVWFKDTTRFTLADGFLRVGVPNLFIGGWLENHFADTIAKASEEVSGGKVDVTFVIDATLTRSLHRRQLDTQGEYLASNPQRMARERKRSGEPPMPEIGRAHV